MENYLAMCLKSQDANALMEILNKIAALEVQIAEAKTLAANPIPTPPRPKKKRKPKGAKTHRK